MTDYLLLIAVIIVLIYGAVRGYTRGFLRQAVWFAGLIAILFIVTRLSPVVSAFLIDNTTVYDKVREKIITVYETEKAEEAENPGSATVPGGESEDSQIDSFGFPSIISDSLKENNTGEIYDRLSVLLFKDYVSGYLAELSIKAGTFVGLFVLLAIAEFILITAIKILEKIPVLETFNKLLGMAMGLTLALVFIWVFFLFVMMFFGRGFGSWVFSQVKASRFLTFLFNNNILFGLIK